MSAALHSSSTFSSSAPPAVRAVGLRKSFGDHAAVRGIDFTVARGEVFGLIGPNGAGKSTVLRVLIDAIRRTGGDLTVLGADPQTAGAGLRARIGYLPGDFRSTGFVGHKGTGQELLAFLGELSGPETPAARRAERVADLAARLGCDLDRPVRDLSKGNRQKLGIIQAFMHSPELLILDEPTSGLDPLVQREFLQLVREAAQAGATVILSSHILSEIQHAADHVVLLSHGTVLFDGRVEQLRHLALRTLEVTVAPEDGELLDKLAQLPTVTQPQRSTLSTGEVRLDAHVSGDLNPVLRVLATGKVTDLRIEEPALEDSIIAMYDAHDEPTSKEHSA